MKTLATLAVLTLTFSLNGFPTKEDCEHAAQFAREYLPGNAFYCTAKINPPKQPPAKGLWGL